MEVLSHLELVNLIKTDEEIQQQKEYYEFLWVRFGQDVGSFHTSMFYSQPFKPEMITGLFDGWKIDEINTERAKTIEKIVLKKGNDNKSKNREWAMIEYYHLIDTDEIKSISYGVLNNWIIDETRSKFPRTLDDFINDASRAGIELEWKVK